MKAPIPVPGHGTNLATESVADLARIAKGFRGRRCVVVGDALLDVFERGRAERLAPDAPAPVLQGVERESSPGGAANVAANLKALGAEVALVSVVGCDGAGDEILASLAALGVDTENVLRVPGRATVAKRRIVADGVTLARLDSGDTGALEGDISLEVARRTAALAEEAEAVVVSDYSGGVVGGEVAEALAQHGCVVLDSKNPLRLRWRGLAAATPNHLEAQRALGLGVEVDPEKVDVDATGRALQRKLGSPILALTLAEGGVAVVDRSGAVTRVAGRQVGEAHPNGAGDTFLSAFALALCGGAPSAAAARLGVEAATLAVARPGTAPVGLPELLRSLGAEHRAATLEEDLSRVRRAGGRVVLAWAAFDPLLPGHLRALREARGMGDLLVVGLLVDEEGGEERLDLLGELRCVDHVSAVVNAESAALIEYVTPDVCILGGAEDWAAAESVEASGGEVVFSAALAEGVAARTSPEPPTEPASYPLAGSVGGSVGGSVPGSVGSGAAL